MKPPASPRYTCACRPFVYLLWKNAGFLLNIMFLWLILVIISSYIHFHNCVIFCISSVQSLSHVQLFVTPWTSQSPGQNTGVGSRSLLQGIFLIQGLNLGLPRCRRILYQLSHKGSPRILEWVACPFSSGSSWPRNWSRGSCIAGRFFTNWTTKET